MSEPFDFMDDGDMLPDAGKPAPAEQIAASFEYCRPGAGIGYGVNAYSSRGRPAMIQLQKYRNNYSVMDRRDVASTARALADSNWFLRGVLPLRHGSQTDGFTVCTADGSAMPADAYDFHRLMGDVFWEDLRTSNAVALWRKGVQNPSVSILKGEQVEFHSFGGVQVLRFQVSNGFSRSGMTQQVRDAIVQSLGTKMGNAHISGGRVEIVKSLDGVGGDEEWDFAIMPGGESQSLIRPEIESIMDPLDFLELMTIGDWNLGWARKDVVRLIKKGYKGSGTSGSLNGVDISPGQIKSLGDGWSKLNGYANIPANHDVDPSYLTLAPENFDPKQVESAIDKLKMYGGIESAVLLGGFSQQNGAAPTLMRHARVSAWARRARVARFLKEIFSADEFAGVLQQAGGELKCKWSDRTLYSVEELLSMVTKTADGVASTRTRRELLDLDHTRESDRTLAEHAKPEAVTPAFHPTLVASNADTEPGRPATDPGV